MTILAMNIISMKSITLLFTLMLVVVWANAQEVSLDRQESTGRTYFRVVVQDEWDFANPQIAGGKQYGQSPVSYTASSAGLASLLNPAPPAPHAGKPPRIPPPAIAPSTPILPTKTSPGQSPSGRSPPPATAHHWARTVAPLPDAPPAPRAGHGKAKPT